MSKNLKDWVKTVIIALAIGVILNKGIIVNATVPTPSMQTTIMVGDRLIANRLEYKFHDPERGDVVIFISRENDDQLFVKRLIGLPGEKVEIIEGTIFINDIPIEEDYKDQSDIRSFGPYQVPVDHYFFLGDNRSNSKDARVWTDTYISSDDLVGKVIFKYFPHFELID